MSYKLGSLFDGSGGFPLAGALCGIEPVWASEVEPYPIAVTKSRFKNMKHLGDISKINGAEIEPVDIITFGSPCQDLSVAGKRAGLKHEANGDEETTRSGLFIEAVRIIKEMREATNGEYPRYAIWENVPGAFSSNRGEDFRVVLEELIKVVEPTAVMPEVPQKGWNYADCYTGDGWSLAYRVLDAQYWGVPQRRRRIYLVTDFRGECAKEILFEREGLRGYFTQGRTPWQNPSSYAEGGSRANDREGEVPYTLKIRSGVSVDSYGKAAGKGALIQENLSATLGTCQDQYLFQPVGADPYNGDLTGDKSSTLGVNCGVSTGRNSVIAIDKESYSSGSGFDRAPGITVGGPCATLQAQGVPHAVCYSEPMLFENHGQEVRFKGPLDVAPTAQAGYGEGGSTKPLVVETVLCLQGNGIDRADNAGCNGKGWREEQSYTLNTMDRPAVVYSVDQGGGKSSANVTEEKAPTLCTTHGGEPAVAYGLDRASFNQGQNAKFDFQIEEEGQPTLTARDPGAVAFAANQRDEVRDLGAKAGALQAEPGMKQQTFIAQPPHYIVRRLTPTECARLQGFADRWGDIDAIDNFNQKDYRFWLEVRNTHARINGKKEQDYTVKQMLTWYNKLQTDSSEYKMWGNGIALPTALYVMQGVAEALSWSEFME